MAMRLERNVGGLEARADVRRQHRITSADIHGFVGPTAAVHGHHVVGLGQQFEAPWLVKTMTGQVQRVVVVRRTPTLEEVEVMILACNGLRDLRRPVFDAPTVGREHRDASAGPPHQGDSEMLALALGCGQIPEMPVMRSDRQGRQVHQQFHGHAPLS